MQRRERLGQRPVDAAIRASDGFGTGSLDHINRR
jgi:hypothetical protein